ncbi:universal stress protein [Halomicroarcula sp. GCM10025709]|uniref:universal stress protein n=1 Tax=Haloarcula TaxID=2237 RepID=UPI0024C26374|nr:universal stress protein [Halomicroarcula sp. YJ-61-S]
MFRTILVPTDGSAGARRAFAHAVALAERYRADVHTLAVDSADGGVDTTARLASTVEAADTTADVTQADRTGVAHEEILDYAEAVGADLLVLGTHGRTGVRRYLLGSVTEKVVRLSDVPVLTVRAGDDARVRFPYQNVLVPTDGSEQAAAAVDPATDIAATCEAHLHAVSVVDTRAMGTVTRPDVLLDQLKSQARSAVDAVAREASHGGVDSVRTAVQEGLPYRALLAYVDEFDIDLVVMGTHGRRGVDRYLLGSVTEKLVRTAPAPVLSVRAPDDAAQSTGTSATPE